MLDLGRFCPGLEFVRFRNGFIYRGMCQFNIRLAKLGDVEMISWHRARMFQDMGELPPELFETFRVQSRDKLRRMFERGEYIGWLASPERRARPHRRWCGRAPARGSALSAYEVERRNYRRHWPPGHHSKRVYRARMAPARAGSALSKEDNRLVAPNRSRLACSACFRRRPPSVRATRLRRHERNETWQRSR
jgi:hypothetical protein